MSITDDIGGRAQDLDRIYQEARPELLGYFRRRHGSPETAEDLLQETFAAVLRHPQRLLQADSPRAYLFGVARNISADALRRARPAEVPLEEAAAAEEEPDPRLETMREAIGRLNPALRQVLELRLRQELAYEEIAGLLNIPVGTVRSRLHHAVKNLRGALQAAHSL
ncbi:MAG: sigma-70 family RNA polymerase sigma factor [Verrucomicrobiota bacterium]